MNKRTTVKHLRNTIKLKRQWELIGARYADLREAENLTERKLIRKLVEEDTQKLLQMTIEEKDSLERDLKK